MEAIRIAAADPRGSLRLVGRALWVAAVLVICLPPHLLWHLSRRPSPWPRHFLRHAARACGARVAVVGAPLRQDVFFVANHLSWLDIPILGGITGTVFVSQDKIRDWPIVGRLARLHHTIFVSRTERLAVDTQIAELRAALTGHRPITLFPEGTTTDGRSLLPFKPPLFQVLLPPPRALRIQPVVLEFDQAGKALAWIGTETAPENAWRVFRRAGGFDVRVHFLAPFDPGEHRDRKAICARARDAIATALGVAPALAAPAPCRLSRAA